MATNGKRMIGVGSPIVDILAQVEDDFITQEIHGEKGGMELISAELMREINGKIPGTTVKAPGGSAGNTTFALAKMGANCAFLGKIGSDNDGEYYKQSFEAFGGDSSRFKYCKETATACCISLITPDSERTMRTDLGAAAQLLPTEISVKDFLGFNIAHIEGYLLFNPELAETVLKSAKAAGCKVSLDLGSFEVVKAAESMLHRLLEDYVDYVFANEDEAEAFCSSKDPEVALASLNKLCEVAVVKLGADGALIKKTGEDVIKAKAVKANNVVDTTGAGDFWAAGFIYGVLNDLPLEKSAELGAVLGCEVVQQIGASLPDESWSTIENLIK